MKHYIRSYWTKYKQLYKKGLKGIAAFLAIGAIIVFVLATIASRGMGVIFNEVMARQTMMRGTVTVICYTVGNFDFYRASLEGPRRA